MRTRINQNKEQIFCEWRHRWVRLTPEEWVRQQLLHHLVEQLDYPASLIAVEVPLEKLSIVNSQFSIKQRCDAVVYAKTSLPCGEGKGGVVPLMLIECKAETVPLTQKTLDQALTYNRKLNVPHLLLYNGIQAIYVNGNDHQSSGCPRYADLLRGQ
ncbi:MAG: type I restriction enzyme HsdR N-terminal domain-containing protein [Paludibacteraceae bacterium]|nr:type I restriction enzyme HsdR N-terminal domain-containing protein [Paludibacteraceae bacterium]